VRTQDEQRWSLIQSELRNDETGTTFLAFFEFWFDAADTLMWEGTGGQPIGSDPVSNMSAVEAMRMALEMAEGELGFLNVDWIGQMLCVASMHWEHGEEMSKEMTLIEQRVMEEALARKLKQLQEQATADEAGLDTVG